MNPPAILIVEDCSDDAELLKLRLRRCGVGNACHTVTNAEDALAYVLGWGQYSDRQRYPAAGFIFVDLKLPQVSGLQLLERLMRTGLTKDVLLVVVSGTQNLDPIREAYRLGVHSFLAKPCQVADIENLIQGFSSYWQKESPLNVTNSPRDL